MSWEEDYGYAQAVRVGDTIYTGILGLRLVKKTVNFDDPETYHLYYGDGVGTPGSVLTFFPWQGLPYGRAGTGQVSAMAFATSSAGLAYWQQRYFSARPPRRPRNSPTSPRSDLVALRVSPDKSG